MNVTAPLHSIHAVDQLVDQLLAVSPVSTLGLVEAVALEHIPAARRRELEGPEEIRDLLEVGARGVELVDDVLNAVNAVLLPEGIRDDRVVTQGDPGLADLAKAALVDERAHGLQRGEAVGDVGLDALEHVD